MKAFTLLVTILCIANVNCGLHSLEPSAWRLDRWDGSWAQHKWEEKAQVARNSINADPGHFQKVNTIPNSYITPLWKYTEIDGRLHGDQVGKLVTSIYGWGAKEAFRDKVREFVVKNWGFFDRDENGLDFQEFKDLIFMLAATEAQVYMEAFDFDGNNILSGNELTYWHNHLITLWSQEGVNEDVHAAMKEAYNNAQEEGNRMTMFELTKFIVALWNIRLQ